MMFRLKVGALCFVTGLGSVAGEVDFQREVRPILSDKCFACHGFDEKTREADLRLDTPEGAYSDLGGYAAVVPGDVEKSEAFQRIVTNDPDEVMPPPKAHKELTDDEIKVLRSWIEEGAKYEDHWSYQPLKNPSAPQGREIDHFVAKKWTEEEVKGSKSAEKVTLVRRLSWDLRGVPPSSAEVEAFKSDNSPEAFSKLVDQFLADQKFGERMAVWWLDLVRYADTIGYHSDNPMPVSPYRDYVIKAFHENKPFDQFTIEQLAGDLLENPSRDQRIASGYNRLLQTTEEGGAQEKEYRAIYAADRVRNVSEVWLGSTLGCAQCHDHKYDPFTARDFYSMAAFFADINEVGIGKRRPNLLVLSAEEEAKIREIEEQIKAGQIKNLLENNEGFRAKVEAAKAEWLAGQVAVNSPWRAVEISDLKSPKGTVLTVQSDGSVLESGKVPGKASYQFQVASPGTVAELRIDALTNKSFATQGGFSRSNGNFVLTGVEVKREGALVKIAKARADFEQPGFPAKNAIDGKGDTGWAVGANSPEHRKGTRRIAFLFDKPIELTADQKLEVNLHYQSAHPGHTIARFAVNLSNQTGASLEDPPGLTPAVLAAFEASPRTAEQEKVLSEHYLRISPEVRTQKQRLKDLEAELKKVNDGMRKMLVAEAMEKPRVTRILARGNWMDESGEIVEPAVPEFLQEGTWQVEGRANRLDLAKWILHEDNPLAARTVVNRVWRLLFGRGLAANVTDLGGQGTAPSHPELLDWLARDFRENGWDLKRLVRQIVSSEAYRQRSEVSSMMREKDPVNELVTRQGRWRVEAEFVRDAALQLAGILNADTIGGPSVKPYQPKGYWRHLNFPRKTWVQDEGGDLYRRSLYTFLCRTFPHPSMVAFDASSREECTAERASSNIPQQALAMLNDPIFVEAARVIGNRISSREGEDPERISWAIREAFSREPKVEEIELLRGIFEKQKKSYSSRPTEAMKFLNVGEWESPDGDPVIIAAWAQVARVILNAYETTSRY